MKIHEIYLAGGCFWGSEQYLENIFGVQSTEVGYANGTIQNPTYEEVCSGMTGFAETVKVIFDEHQISLSYLLELFYESINPTSVNRQGGDIGSQYRTGVYYTEQKDREVILHSLELLQTQYDAPVVVESKPLENYYKAEEYHQKYLTKNTNGYCHIPAKLIEKVKGIKVDPSKYQRLDDETLKKELSPLAFAVTQENATERPFENAFDDLFEKGIYVDITSGEPLFLSSDKFDAGCGWPAFSKPIDLSSVKELVDNSLFHKRVEVRSRVGNAHLGHVFEDGPQELGGLRYCINSASLRFIPYDQMEQEGYAEFISLLDK